MQRLAVLFQEFRAILTKIKSAPNLRIRLVAHQTLPQNTIILIEIDPIFGAEIHSFRRLAQYAASCVGFRIFADAVTPAGSGIPCPTSSVDAVAL